MLYELILSATALMESEIAYLFYETQSEGLGQRFLDSVQDTLNKLSHNPKSYSYINSNKNIRDVKIKNFPFLIIYQIKNNKVLILRVFNTNRDPRLLKKL